MTTPASDKRIGVLLFNLGGPETLDDVRPFLFNIFVDPDIIRLPSRALQKPLAWLISTQRHKKSRGYYEQIGGGSPLRRITEEQARALEQSLASRNISARAYVRMRYWNPFIEEALEQIRRDQIDHLVVLPLYPQFSVSTTGSSLNRMQAISEETGHRLPPTSVVCSWEADENYIEAMAAAAREELALFPDQDGHAGPERLLRHRERQLLPLHADRHRPRRQRRGDQHDRRRSTRPPRRSARPALVLADTGPYAFVNGTTGYYNGAVGTGSSITVTRAERVRPRLRRRERDLPLARGIRRRRRRPREPVRRDVHVERGDRRRRADRGRRERHRPDGERDLHARPRRDGARRRRPDRQRRRGQRRRDRRRSTRPARSRSTRAPTSPRRLGAASSGLASSVLVHDQAPLTGNTCGTFGSPVTITGNPGQTGLATGCWRYTLTGTDNVGNAVSVTTTVKVDTSAAAFGRPRSSWARPARTRSSPAPPPTTTAPSGRASTITVVAPTVADPDSGVAQVAWPAPAGFTGGGVDTVPPFGTTYTWAAATGAGTQTVTATNGTGLTSCRDLHARARRDGTRRRRADRERHRGERRGQPRRRSRPRRSPSGCAPTSPRR